jgi:hypothetical protein
MGCIDAEYIAFAGLPQVLLDVADTVDSVGRDPAKRHAGSNRTLDHSRRKLRLGREGDFAGYIRGFQTSGIVGPALRQIERPIDKSMAMARHVGGEYADLAISEAAGRSRRPPPWRYPWREAKAQKIAAKRADEMLRRGSQ